MLFWVGPGFRKFDSMSSSDYVDAKPCEGLQDPSVAPEWFVVRPHKEEQSEYKSRSPDTPTPSDARWRIIILEMQNEII